MKEILEVVELVSFLKFTGDFSGWLKRTKTTRYVSHMTGTSTAIGLRLEGFHHDKHEDDILIQARPVVLVVS